MKLHPSALKHGVSSEDAIQAAEWSLWIEPSTRLLEAVVLVFESGDEMVIHAMPARERYVDLLP